MTELQQHIIDLVNEVPEGYVVSFGAIAKEILKRTKRSITAQMVGRQLSGLPEHEWWQLPRWRVVNRQGYVSSLNLGTKGFKQISLLEKEGWTMKQGYIQDPEWRLFT